jgi:DNA-binding PadR family transcriptional regulator
MSLRYALLGLIAEEPMSGYDLTKRFAGPGYVWSARHSQIYPELARLLEEGLIRVDRVGPRGRKQYRITAAGLADVRRWLTETTPDRTARSEAFLRVFFLWLVPPAAAREYLESELAYHRALLHEYEAIATRLHETTGPDRWTAISLQAGILHEEALARWAEWALTQVGPARRRGSRARASRRAAAPRRSS